MQVARVGNLDELLCSLEVQVKLGEPPKACYAKECTEAFYLPMWRVREVCRVVEGCH